MEPVRGLPLLRPRGRGHEGGGGHDHVGDRRRPGRGPAGRQAEGERQNRLRSRRPPSHRGRPYLLPRGHGRHAGHVPLRRGPDKRGRGPDRPAQGGGPPRSDGLQLQPGRGRRQAPGDPAVQRPFPRRQHGPGPPVPPHGVVVPLQAQGRRERPLHAAGDQGGRQMQLSSEDNGRLRGVPLREGHVQDDRRHLLLQGGLREAGRRRRRHRHSHALPREPLRRGEEEQRQPGDLRAHVLRLHRRQPDMRRLGEGGDKGAAVLGLHPLQQESRCTSAAPR